MRIILVNKYWYERGGTERVLFLTKKLLEDAGHEVEIFGMHDEKNIFENKYFIDNIDYTKARGIQKITQARNIICNNDAKEKFKKLLNDFAPDLVHFHNIYHQLSFSLVEACDEMHIPSVMTLHDYKMISPNYTMYHHGHIDDSMLGKNYYRCLFGNCMENIYKSFVFTLEAYWRVRHHIQEKITYYIAPSEFMKELCVGAGIQETIEVIANPIASETFGTYKEKNYVGYTGRLSEEKGVEYLIAAARETPEILYKIAGSGPDEARLKKLAKDLQNVEFVGWLDGEDLFRFIGEARLLVVPSVWYENYPYSILRPQQLAKVVIGSNLGGIPELLPENCLFESKNISDMIERIRFWYMAPAKERASLGKLFQKRIARENSPQSYLEKILDLYEKVSARRKK